MGQELLKMNIPGKQTLRKHVFNFVKFWHNCARHLVGPLIADRCKKQFLQPAEWCPELPPLMRFWKRGQEFANRRYKNSTLSPVKVGGKKWSCWPKNHKHSLLQSYQIANFLIEWSFGWKSECKQTRERGPKKSWIGNRVSPTLIRSAELRQRISSLTESFEFSPNTSLAVPGALSHCMQRYTVHKYNKGVSKGPMGSYETRSISNRILVNQKDEKIL